MNFKLSPHPARFAHHKMDVLLAHSHKRNPQSSSKTLEWDFCCLSFTEWVSSVRGNAVSSNEPSDSVKDDFGVHNGRRETRLCVCGKTNTSGQATTNKIHFQEQCPKNYPQDPSWVFLCVLKMYVSSLLSPCNPNKWILILFFRCSTGVIFFKRHHNKTVESIHRLNFKKNPGHSVPFFVFLDWFRTFEISQQPSMCSLVQLLSQLWNPARPSCQAPRKTVKISLIF